MSTSSYASKTESAISRQAIVILTKFKLDPTPANLHLLVLLLKEENAELKQSFLQLKRPISQSDLTELAHRFLPFLFEPTETLVKAVALARSLPSVEAGLATMHDSLQEAEELLSNALAVVADMHEPSMAPLSKAMDELRRRRDDQARVVAELQASLAGRQSDRAEVDHVVGTSSAPGELPQVVSQLPPAMDVVVSHGLAGRTVIMDRLQALYSGEQQLHGYSLILCHVVGFDAYRGPVMEKARDYLLDTIGQHTGRLIGADDSASWMAADELGLLLSSSNEIYLTNVSNRIRHMVGGALGHARRTVVDLPVLNCRFGCATAYGSASPTQLYSSARLALQRAELREEDTMTINAVSPLAGNRRYHAIYSRHQQ